LRAKDRDTVHELAKDHLHGPGQTQPHADTRKLGRAEREALLDPHVARDVDDTERAIGKIDQQ
jgi:hypothetical protein